MLQPQADSRRSELGLPYALQPWHRELLASGARGQGFQQVPASLDAVGRRGISPTTMQPELSRLSSNVMPWGVLNP